MKNKKWELKNEEIPNEKIPVRGRTEHSLDYRGRSYSAPSWYWGGPRPGRKWSISDDLFGSRRCSWE